VWDVRAIDVNEASDVRAIDVNEVLPSDWRCFVNELEVVLAPGTQYKLISERVDPDDHTRYLTVVAMSPDFFYKSSNDIPAGMLNIREID